MCVVWSAGQRLCPIVTDRTSASWDWRFRCFADNTSIVIVHVHTWPASGGQRLVNWWSTVRSVRHFSPLSWLSPLMTSALCGVVTSSRRMIERSRPEMTFSFVSLSTTIHSSNIHPRNPLFLLRDAMRKRGLCCRPVSIRPSVCPSRWCTVSRRLKISSNFFLGPVAPSF